MIPYEDLVAALSSWRIKQGLPVEDAALAPVASRATPPPAPRTSPPAAPPPLMDGEAYQVDDAAMVEESAMVEEAPLGEAALVEEAALLEETAYDSEGADFAMAFGQAGSVEAEHEATSIGDVPEPPDPAGSHGRNDW